METQQAPWDFVEQYYVDDLAERESAESQFALSWVKEVDGDSVLSLGCGPNFYDECTFFSKLPKKIVGIDLNENNLAFLNRSTHPELLRCKKLLADTQTIVSLIRGDIRTERNEFIHSFDTVYASGVLSMFAESDLRELLQLIYHYLKPGGRLVDIDWTDCRLSSTLYAERERYEWYSTQGPSIERVGELLTDSGFFVAKHSRYTVPDPEEYGWGMIYAYIGVKG